MRGVVYENNITKELVSCDNPQDITEIDGEQYITVYKLDDNKRFLVNLNAYTRVRDTNSKR